MEPKAIEFDFGIRLEICGEHLFITDLSEPDNPAYRS